MEREDDKPKRRIRYKGTHPRSFKEKYKELQPEKYSADIEKIKQKGGTPAGMHRSICVDEILKVLQITPGQVGMDATLGYGGHSLEMLKQLTPGGILYATDVDPFELPKTTKRLAGLGFGEDVFKPRRMNFSNIDLIVAEAGLLHFVLADWAYHPCKLIIPNEDFHSRQMDH
jgi:16S rRNA (cytosine1402-N4)-methyltransferase